MESTWSSCALLASRRPDPKGRRQGPPPPYRRWVIFYAVVSGEIHQVIEFYRTPAEAEAMVELVLKDEPDWEDVLWVEPVELVTGGRN
jgi:hypothetical protein